MAYKKARVDDEVVVSDPGQEEWRIVAAAPQYEVSSWGRFRNSRTGHLLSVSPKGNGYHYVRLGKDPGWTIAGRQVARAFLGKPELSDDVVSYRDEDLTNLRVENLYWTRHKSRDPERRAFLRGFEDLCELYEVEFKRTEEAERIAVNLKKLAPYDELLKRANRFLKSEATRLRADHVPALRSFSTAMRIRYDR